MSYRHWMRLLLLAAIGCFVAAPALAQQHIHNGVDAPADQASDAAFQAFAGACAPNLGRPEVMQLVMSAVGLQKANERVTAAVPHEAEENVWIVQEAGIGVAAVWKPDATRCRVLMQRGDLDRLKTAFSTLLTDTAKPGLAVDKVKDASDPAAPKGPVETVAYEVYATPKSPDGDDRLYTLTLHRGEDAEPAAVIEGRRISGKPKS